MIAELCELGAENSTWMSVSPRCTVGFAGAAGTSGALNGADALDAVLLPTTFVATTLHVYDASTVKLLTVIGDAPEPVRCVPPLLLVHVAVWPVIALPPVPLSVNETCASAGWPSESALTIVGASGTVAGTTAPDAPDSSLSPTVLLTWTVHV